MMLECLRADMLFVPCPFHFHIVFISLCFCSLFACDLCLLKDKEQRQRRERNKINIMKMEGQQKRVHQWLTLSSQVWALFVYIWLANSLAHSWEVVNGLSSFHLSSSVSLVVWVFCFLKRHKTTTKMKQKDEDKSLETK